MNTQRLLLAQKQLQEEIAPALNTTLETDKTSKYGSKYGAYAVRTEEGRPYVVGLQDLPTKSGEDTLKTLKAIKSNIFNANDNIEPSISHNILYNLRNTMSDCAATEMKFNELLQLYRAEILPQVVDNWEELTPELKAQLPKMNNFFCGLHGLVHIAETANKAMQESEGHHFDGHIPIHDQRFRKSSESGCCRLVRTACQAFAFGGDAKNGCHGCFSIYIKDMLKESGFGSLPLTPYRGSRFNILFHNAGVIYWLKRLMLEFLQDDGSNPWVRHDLQIPFYIAGTKALGLISKLITTPLWDLIEDKSVHILDMNTKYLELQTYLIDAAKNIDQFMAGGLKG